MARCIHEVMIPIYNPFSNPFSSGTTTGITELRSVCGRSTSLFQGMECQGIRCSHYKPESVVNRLPNKTEGEHEPPPI